MNTKVTIYMEPVNPLSASQSGKGRIDKFSKSSQADRVQEAFLSRVLTTGQLIDLLLCFNELGIETASRQEHRFTLIDREGSV